MHRSLFFSLLLLASSLAPLQADDAAPDAVAKARAAEKLGASGGGIEARLGKALQMFPEADADHDGKLSIDEAMKYLQAHPELKAKLGVGGAQERGTSAVPPLREASAKLPPGPRLFVCAHSFMIYTARLLPPMAEAAGIGYRSAGQQMLGGSQVIQHWNLPGERNLAKKVMAEGAADVLTLSPHILMPDPGIDLYTKLGLEHNPKLRVLVQASWPARDGDVDGSKGFEAAQRDAATGAALTAQLDAYHETWLRPLEAQVRKLNAEVGQESVHIIPAGDAVIALRKLVAEGKAPGLRKQTEMFGDALGHPTGVTQTLVTYCHFAAIYGRNPAGLPVPQELKAYPESVELNALLQKIAWETVTNYPLSGVRADGGVAAAAGR